MYKILIRNLLHNHFLYCAAAVARRGNIFIQNCVTQICIMKKKFVTNGVKLDCGNRGKNIGFRT